MFLPYSKDGDPRKERYIEELIQKIQEGTIKNKEELETEKLRMAKRFGVFNVIKNAELISFAKTKGLALDILRTKPIRTQSGIANIAVMWKGPQIDEKKFYSCPGACIYCPQGEDSPKAYHGVEPATMRARRFRYDPYMQVQNRLRQFNILGHNTDKCELIIMGGTFTAMPYSFQEEFGKRCFDSFNLQESANLEEAQMKNEIAKNRVVGLTIETRADYCSDNNIQEMLKLGCTRVEIGIQTTNGEILSRINRGHTIQENIVAVRRLKEAGLKFTAHWMPGLSGLIGKPDPGLELEMFRQLFEKEYAPDELKIYPLVILPDTEIYRMWKRGEFETINDNDMAELLIKMKMAVPPYVRIKRIMRDISEHEAIAGARTTNLRQLVKMRMETDGKRCRCIRCREIGLDNIEIDDAKMNVTEYDASEGKEIFISFDTKTMEKIIAFLRLRIDNEIAKIRELHVYGEMTPFGKKIAVQHHGYGKKLMEKAEEIAADGGGKKIFVTSGVGVRRYYIDKFNYQRDGHYLSKIL